jgi:hypothetical protein
MKYKLLKDYLAAGKLRRLRVGIRLKKRDRFFDPAYAGWFPISSYMKGNKVGPFDDYRRPVGS